ncbi:hypothetical protein EJ110_NYTH38899 [Nymphaea thermarum]|nr:hypothetical protein EJ110_NYTH38899 [Nymphaea thermarum]
MLLCRSPSHVEGGGKGLAQLRIVFINCDAIRIEVVLDPRFKLSYLKYLLDDLDKPDAMVKYEAVEKILHELYVEYKNMYDESDAMSDQVLKRAGPDPPRPDS